MKLVCPFDGEPLERTGNRLVCCNSHSFDIARQGYVNLLPVQSKRSRDPGDSKEMVAARSAFLNQDFYQSVAEHIADRLLTLVPEGARCVDAGCGEGYYLRALARKSEGHALDLMGLDISKWAVLAAARQSKDITWVVASNVQIPVAAASVDALLCIFGFPVPAEFDRVLNAEGLLITADPGPGHLHELRQIIYPQVRTADSASEHTYPRFKALHSETLNYQITLTSQQQIASLLAMTPHLFRAPAAGRERASRLHELTVTVEVVVRVLQK